MKINNVNEFKGKIKSVLITEEQISQKIKQTADMINKSYNGKPLLFVSILKGSFVFLADLIKKIDIPCEVAFMAAKSYYDGTSSTGEVTITMDLDKDISGYNVIIIEDIIDTGRTLKDIVNILKSRDPVSVKVITLLDKPQRRLVDFKADFSLFEIDDLFVIGYGLDFGEYYRNLPFIAELSE